MVRLRPRPIDAPSHSSSSSPLHTPLHLDGALVLVRPDWLANATYLGKTTVQGRSVLAWTKVDFITYYADPVSSES